MCSSDLFAPVPMAWLKDIGADENRLNPNGGAIALGHPLGGSGALFGLGGRFGTGGFGQGDLHRGGLPDRPGRGFRLVGGDLHPAFHAFQPLQQRAVAVRGGR